MPLPALPDLGVFSFDLLAGALAVAVIVLVQGAGVSESAANPDGTSSDANRDFVAQGAGNVVAAIFRGQPVGGLVGQTALNRTLGARTRWGGHLLQDLDGRHPRGVLRPRGESGDAEVIGESTLAAVHAAEAWLVSTGPRSRGRSRD